MGQPAVLGRRLLGDASSYTRDGKCQQRAHFLPQCPQEISIYRYVKVMLFGLIIIGLPSDSAMSPPGVGALLVHVQRWSMHAPDSSRALVHRLQQLGTMPRTQALLHAFKSAGMSDAGLRQKIILVAKRFNHPLLYPMWIDVVERSGLGDGAPATTIQGRSAQTEQLIALSAIGELAPHLDEARHYLERIVLGGGRGVPMLLRESAFHAVASYHSQPRYWLLQHLGGSDPLVRRLLRPWRSH